MAVELHLPDLPEVPVAVGSGLPPRPRASWRVRLRDLLATYLPLLLMALLALGSWWLVKNVPPAQKPRPAAPPRAEPDYTMSGFALERFAQDGRLKLRLHGAQMRHFPDTDRIEVEQLRAESFATDGRVTRAQAQRGLSNGDASEIQLFGQVEITQPDRQGVPVRLSSEFLHLYTASERVRTHRPVRVEHNGARLSAQGMNYDHASGQLAVTGPARLVLPPGGPERGARRAGPAKEAP
jgi:lipopolysaccharide export system protein LptC